MRFVAVSLGSYVLVGGLSKATPVSVTCHNESHKWAWLELRHVPMRQAGAQNTTKQVGTKHRLIQFIGTMLFDTRPDRILHIFQDTEYPTKRPY